MARGQRKKTHLSNEEVCQRVAQIMDQWAAFSCFASLFDALLTANNNCNNSEFARLLAQRTDHTPGYATIARIRTGTSRPTYAFITDILNHNLLRLGEDASHPGSSRRAALFAAAGLIEVTPESISKWNQDVLAGLEQALENPRHKRPRWGDVMSKLFAFHTQGERQTQMEVVQSVLPENKDESKWNTGRISAFLSNMTIPALEERTALARAVGLTDDQIRYLESQIEADRLLLADRKKPTTFGKLLKDSLRILKSHGFTQRDVVDRSTDLTTKTPGLNHPGVISGWHQGKTAPSLEGLRALCHGLERCLDSRGKPILAVAALTGLIEAAGYKPRQLTDTTHDIIAQITESTEINSLLADIRRARDVSVPLSAIVEIDTSPSSRSVRLPNEVLVNRWEHGGNVLPTSTQVHELLDRYNRIIAAKGLPPMSAKELAAVEEVAERSRTRWREASQVERLSLSKPREPRRLLSPRFDGGPTR